MNRTVCIKYKNYDLLRIIPFSVGRDYDFKIDTLDNDYQVSIHHMNDSCYYYPIENFHSNQWEITYHKRSGQNPTKFHFKKKHNSDNNNVYVDIPLHQLTDPNILAEFPIPLMKISISKNGNFKKYKYKKKYCVCDIKDFNIVEIYLVNSNFKFHNFETKWDIFDLIYGIAPIGYFTNGKLGYDFEESKFSQGNFTREVIEINKDVKLLFNYFQSSNIYDEHEKDSFISIYENGDYLKYLVSAPISYRTLDGLVTKPQSAFVLQMNRCKNRMSIDEYRNWYNYFQKWHEKSINENLKITGFIL